MPRDYYGCTRSCTVCGKVMTGVGSGKKFCEDCYKVINRESERVRNRKRKKPPMKTYPESKCEFCNRPFVPHRHNQIYCSVDCYEENRRDKQRKTFKMRDYYRLD